jgi:thioredoxin 1
MEGKVVEKGRIKLSRRLVIKIVVPALIIIGVVVIWITKNNNELTKGNETIAEKNNLENGVIAEIDNVDFELNMTEEIDLEQLKSYGIPIVIDFGADSCIPCKEMAPVLEKLNEELKGKAIVRFVDVWKYPELAANFPISIIPTQVLIDKDGKPYIPTETNSQGMIIYETKDTNEHVFTTHEGGITEEEMLKLLKEMGMDE